MSTQTIPRPIKVVDKPEKPPIIAPVANHDFLVKMRHAKLIELAAIEEQLGIVYQRCPSCNKRNRVDAQG